MIMGPACGGGGGDGGGGLSSGVDPTKPGKDVTLSEAARVCDAVRDYNLAKRDGIDLCQVEGLLEAAFQGATEAELQEVCHRIAEDCRSGDGPSVAFDPAESIICGDWTPNDCSATVGEIERCWRDLIDFEYAIDVPSCSEVTRSSLVLFVEEFTFPSPEWPAGCELPDENCISIFEGG